MTVLAERGWSVLAPLGRGADMSGAAQGVDLLLITTPDDAIRRVATSVEPHPTTVVAHASGAQTLDPLLPHPRRASLHPLASIPDPVVGAARLRAGCSFAVDGDEAGIELMNELVASLGGRAFRVAPQDRVIYHAAAAMAANHLVALLGQVERVAAQAGLPLDAYLDLAAQTLDNVRRLGPAAALTGPVARGDWATVARHLAALDPEEAPAYRAMADQAARLVHPDMCSGYPVHTGPGHLPEHLRQLLLSQSATAAGTVSADDTPRNRTGTGPTGTLITPPTATPGTTSEATSQVTATLGALATATTAATTTAPGTAAPTTATATATTATDTDTTIGHAASTASVATEEVA
ncbi:MAG: DUF2520 domain-containing protein [Acidimicrobiales bacterium]